MLTAEYEDKKTERFMGLLNNKPESGTVLVTKDGNSVRVHVQENETTGQYTMFVNAAVDDDGTGWFIKDGNIGLKCLISPYSQSYLLDRYDTLSDMFISTLKVVRHNKRGTALICEVLS
jgi:hypothetical protein